MDLKVPKNVLRLMINSLAVDNEHKLKEEALYHLLKFTGEKCEEIGVNIHDLLKALIKIIEVDIRNAKIACLCLVNISAKKHNLNKILPYITSYNISNCLLQYIDKGTPEIASAVVMLLCNMTRVKYCATKLYETIFHKTLILESLIKSFMIVDKKSGSFDENYNYISHLLANLCMIHEVRMWLMDSGNFIKLLMFILPEENSVRRVGVIMLVKNCCFELEKHEWLLNLDILPLLLYPLAGPEEFSGKDNEKLPLDLQWLENTKERESDESVRLALVEALAQLCAKKCCREIIRDKRTHLILRELHKWESNISIKSICKNLVDILMASEDEIGIDNFYDFKVPEDVIDNI